MVKEERRQENPKEKYINNNLGGETPDRSNALEFPNKHELTATFLVGQYLLGRSVQFF